MRLDVLALLLCFAALLAAAYVSTSVFDRLPHTEDEIAFLFQAKTLAAGQLVARAPALPDFFFMPFIIVRDGMWFGKYPPGYPAVLALGVLAGQPWIINPLFASLSVGLLYLAGRRLYGASVGLVAAALAVVSPFFILQAGSFLSHVVSLFWALALLLLFQAAWRDGSKGASLGAGAALGMLFLSRPLTAAGIAIPYILWVVIDIVRERRRLLVYLPAVLAFLPFLAVWLAYNNLTTGNMLRTGYELWWPYDRIGFGPGFGMGDGHTIQDGIDSMKTDIDTLATYLFGWPGRLSLVPPVLGAVLAIAGLAWAGLSKLAYGWNQSSSSPPKPRLGDGRTIRPEAWDILQAGVVVSLVAAYLTYWASGQMYGPRYYFEALGALMLLSARGLVQTAGVLPKLLNRLTPAWRGARSWVAAAAVLAVFGVTSTSFTSFVPQEFGRFVRWYNIDDADLRQVQALGLKNAVVFIAASDWPHYSPFFLQNRPTLDGSVIYAMDLGPGRNAELMALYPGRKFFRYVEGRLEPAS